MNKVFVFFLSESSFHFVCVRAQERMREEGGKGDIFLRRTQGKCQLIRVKVYWFYCQNEPWSESFLSKSGFFQGVERIEWGD